MGGEREMAVEKSEVKVAKENGGGVKTDVGAFRVHESNGEVHVHDDANKFKTVVPISVWWKMWDKLRNDPGTWTWIDPQLKTRLTVETVIDQSIIDVKISLSQIVIGDTWEKVNSFTKRK
jgi:hypothetical protein